MLNNTQAHNHLRYWLIPSALVSLMIAMYFSGNAALQQFVAPYPRREFGILENLQNVVLIAIIVIAIMGFRRAEFRLQKTGYGLLTLMTLFLLGEELDYGLHYYEAWHGIGWFDRIEVRNLHNQGDLTDTIKKIVDLGLILFFVILPWCVRETSGQWLRYIAPSRYFTIAAFAMFFLSKFAHALQDAGAGTVEGSIPMLSSNISEFRELFFYYVIMTYLMDVTFRRQWPGTGQPDQAGQTGKSGQ